INHPSSEGTFLIPTPDEQLIHPWIQAKPDYVVVINRSTGAVLRELIPGPVGTYHSNGRKRGRPRKEAQLAPAQVLSAMT
ncbi:MAG: hypothetical protein WCB92_30955, partial [Mycobacterium sp.]